MAAVKKGSNGSDARVASKIVKLQAFIHIKCFMLKIVYLLYMQRMDVYGKWVEPYYINWIGRHII